MKRPAALLLALVLIAPAWSLSQTLNLVPRRTGAPKGSKFVKMISILPLADREYEIYSQILAGNVPDFLRTLVPVTADTIVGGTIRRVTFYVTADYLAIGTNDDYFLTPMTPILAQRIANALNCSLPTRKMVDTIYRAATVKLAPSPIPPSAHMTTVPVFAQHNAMVRAQRDSQIAAHPLGALVGGDKKDVIISNVIYPSKSPKRVVIYGWHKLDGVRIQPLYDGHEETYADYSHGIRLVQNAVRIDTSSSTVASVLADPALCRLLSDEGAVPNPRYPIGDLQVPPPRSFGVFREDGRSLRILLKGTNDTTQYIAYTGTDGVSFRDSLLLGPEGGVATGLTADSICFFRLRAITPSAASPLSEVLAAVPSSRPHDVLIVNGFDRPSIGNTFDFIRQHGRAVLANNRTFSSATNDAVVAGIAPLAGYRIVDYILGDESTVDETLNAYEQDALKGFLENGGRLLVSGSEIAWDLGKKGYAGDSIFYSQYLKAQYVNDAPGGQAGMYYDAEPVAGSIFDGMGTLHFDNGTHGAINVKYPDVISGVNGGVNCLAYSGVAESYAGVSYQGTFPGGTTPGKLVNLGIPFEAFYPDTARNALMRRILNFVDAPVGAMEKKIPAPADFSLSQNFPNPFNPATTLRFTLPGTGVRYRVSLRVFDVLGRMIATLFEGETAAGEHAVAFNASSLPTGIYYCRMTTPSFSATRAMQLIR